MVETQTPSGRVFALFGVSELGGSIVCVHRECGAFSSAFMSFVLLMLLLLFCFVVVVVVVI